MAASGSQRSSGRKYNQRSTGTTNRSRNGSSERNTHNNSYPQRKEVDEKIRQEAVALIVFGVVLMIFLCMINVIKGSFGPAVKYFMLGAFGILGYLIPIAVFVGICFKISNAANRVATLKLISALVLIFMIGILLCYITGMDISYLSGAEKQVRLLYDQQRGGGVIFGLAACWLYHVFGQAGSIFLAIAIALICIILITERSFLGKLKFGSNSFRDRYKEDEDGQYGLIPEDEEMPEEGLALPVIHGNRQSVRERVGNTALEKAKEQQRRREEAKRRRRELEEQREDERIATAHSVHNTKKNKIDIDQVLIEDQKQRNNRDDIHEITLLEEPYEREQKQSDIPSLEMREITIDRGEEQEEKTPDVDIPEIDVSAVDGLYTAAENYTPYGMQMSADNAAAEKLAEHARDTAEETVVAMPDLSQMPQPVTERSHQNGSDSEVYFAKEAESRSASQSVKTVSRPKKYEKPKISLLKKNDNKKNGDSDQELKETALLLQQTLKTFGVTVTVTNISQGPSVTRYELQLGE